MRTVKAQIADLIKKYERGEITLGGLLLAVIMVAVLASAVVAIWPTFVGTDTTIQALTQTDAGTTFMQAVWPIVLLVGGAGIGAGVIIMLLRKFGLIGAD